MSFFFAASLTVNLAFVVVVITMMTSHVMDGMFMNEGLNRYCSSANDSKFDNTSAKVKAMRAYTCGSGDAKQYFENGFNSYLQSKGISN